jgi:protein arginine kinase activator
MICNICTKNEATVHLTEIVDNQVTELHLCEECARKKSVQMEQQFGLADLLAGLADLEQHTQDKEDLQLACSNCGLTYGDFRKLGRLGCSECYASFSKYLGPLLKKIHGADKHLGKAPEHFSPTVKARGVLQEYKEKLSDAIRREAFEEAAALRDKIREFEIKELDKKRSKEKQ